MYCRAITLWIPVCQPLHSWNTGADKKLERAASYLINVRGVVEIFESAVSQQSAPYKASEANEARIRSALHPD
jgi:hypothetical protein